jgi:protein TonB
MFEDATFECTNRVHTQSLGWMIATFSFNGAILLALVLIPLIYPEALPRQAMAFLLEVPAEPPAPVPPTAQQPAAQAFHGVPEAEYGHIFAPSKIPTQIVQVGGPEQMPGGDLIGMGTSGGGSGIPGGMPFGGPATPRIVHQEARGPMQVSSGVVAALLVRKTIPAYPPIARAAHVEGTVVLLANISKSGTIENLRVASGPAMLGEAAMDAVKSWRYRPYLLNGEPVEVETTVSVIFTLGR